MDPDNNIEFAVSLSPDRDHFLRRTCPSCGRDFKTEINQADLQWELASHCKRLGVDSADSGGNEPDGINCPYCSYTSPSAETHTEQTMEYLKRLVHREYVAPLLNRFFGGLEDTIGRSGGSSGGSLSISVEFHHSRSLLPPRPMHGPEPADLKTLEFLCCGKSIKVAESFTSIEQCCYCGTTVQIEC
jgi:hypothetical protein